MNGVQGESSVSPAGDESERGGDPWQRGMERVREAGREAIAEGPDQENIPDAEREDGEDGDEARRMIKMNNPMKPSESEIQEHGLSHLPFRNWCRHCVRGRGKEMAKYRIDEEPAMDEVHVDFCFLGDEDGTAPMTTFVARDRRTKMTLASAVPSKSTGTFIARRVCAFLREIGLSKGDMTMKGDQEPALQAIVDEIGRVRAADGGGRFVCEMSPKGQSGSNGVVERAIQSVQAQVRVMRSALEEKWAVQLHPRHPIFPWMAEYAAVLLNRLEISKDGKTSYERLKGKRAKVLGIEFGEKVLWRRRPIGNALGKLSCMWEDGIYLGVKGTTGEIIVGTTKGIWRTRTLQRRPIEDRWSADAMAMVGGVPWRTSEEDPKMDGEKLETIELPKMDPQVIEDTRSFVDAEPRTFGIKRSDFEHHGYTRGCAGCKAILRGTARQKHSDGCRRRMEDAMRDDDRVRRAKTRRDDFVAKVLEREGKSARKDDDGEDNRKTEKRERESGEFENEDGKKMRREETSSSSGLTNEERSKGLKRAHEAEDPIETDNVAILEVDVSTTAILEVGMSTNEEDNPVDEWAVDDLTGKELNIEAVKKARNEEVQFMEDIGVYDLVDEGECWAKTNKEPISTRWVDINKGTEEEPLVRCRLVARDFKTKKGREDDYKLFAATPPIEALRMLLRLARMKRRRKKGMASPKMKLMFIDVKKAHLNAKVGEDEFVYVSLPEEARAEGKVGRLRRWLYGMRPAASAWEDDYALRLAGAGYVRGVAAPTTFYNRDTDGKCVVHGDDFTFLASEEELKRMEGAMKAWYEIKVKAVMGPDDHDEKEVTVLGRRVRWMPDEIQYEADEKYAKTICEQMGIGENSKGLDWPVVKESGGTDEEEEEMGSEEARRFRGLAATANFLSQDRYDVQFACKEICRNMARPKVSDWGKVKRLARYLRKYPRLIWKFKEVEEHEVISIRVMSDSDWAGCLRSRKSTSGGTITIQGGCIKTWSSTQSSLALSCAEAEYYAAVKAAAEGLGIQSLAQDLGVTMKVQLGLDSSAAKSMAGRLGVGRVRHIELRLLWLQQEVKRGRISLFKIRGEDNPADVGTKPRGLTESRILFDDLCMDVVSA